ncbi:MAG: Cna B-type domain-containing protein [Ruminococcus sp.]|nr:Cna B-type domain-containing protein [Ruminococcus sp.]
MPFPKNRSTRFIVFLLSMLLCISFCAPFTGSCENSSDRSITLICRKDETILTGMQWKLYRIGERSGNSFTLTGDFAGYPIDMSSITEENVEQTAKTIESYAVADGITPVNSGMTDENGELTFGGLTKGLYLAVGKTLKVGNTYYVPSSLLLEAGEKDVSFSYNAYPKFFYATLGNTIGSYTVRKVWVNDSADNAAHPTYVTVDLYCNGELHDTVTLNEDNNWEYRWKELDPTNNWHVAERDIPVDYTVIIDFNSTQYLIKNSYRSTGTTSSTTTTSSITVITTTTTTAINQTTITKPPTTTSALPPLAQTGQLWWPVIPLSAGGLILISLGTLIKTKKNDK